LPRKVTAALVIVSVLLGGCTAARRSAETYDKPVRAKAEALARLETSDTGVKWSTSTIGGEVAALYPLGDVVCVYTKANRLVVFDANRGVERRRMLLPLDLQFGPYRHDDVLYFSIGDTVYGFDTNTGEELWTRSLEVPLSSPPTLFAGQIFAGSRIDIFGAWPVQSNRLAWSILQCRTTEKAAVSGTTVYVPAAGGLLRAVNVADGEVAWGYPTEREFITSPALLESGLVIGTEEGGIYRISEDGKREWLTVLRRPVKKVFAAGDLVIAMTVPDGGVLLDAESGEELRIVPGVVKLAGVSDNIACFVKGRNLVAADRATGQEKWQLPLGEFTVVAENAASNEVYCATKTGALVALELK